MRCASIPPGGAPPRGVKAVLYARATLAQRSGRDLLGSPLAGDGHVLEAIVRQAIDQETGDVVSPGCRRSEIGDEHQRRVLQEGALNVDVLGFTPDRILFEIRRGNLGVEVWVVV